MSPALVPASPSFVPEGAALEDCFSACYAQARERFLQAAAQAGLAVASEVHPLAGRDGEELALDVAVDGPAGAPRLLLVSSGCHGVEGYAGSGVQVAMLRSAAWRAFLRQQDVAVAYLHALNPHGFSHGRRATHENIDLNRNFVDFTAPLPRNPGYEALAPLLVPERWPAGAANLLGLAGHVLRHGLRSAQTAVSAGQYTHPDGLFYGGTAPSWSQQALRRVLRRLGGGVTQLGWIDLHTGLGPRGVGEAILAGPAASAARARAWWGAGVTSVDDGSSVSSPLNGLMWQAAVQECPQAAFTGIVLEFGTVPMLQVLQALRADQWLQNHPGARAEHGEAIRRRLREVFEVDAPDWRRRVADQAFDAARRALEGLAASQSSPAPQSASVAGSGMGDTR